MRTRKNPPSTSETSSLPYVKKLAAITGVVTACAAALGGACGDPQPSTTGAGGATGSSGSSMGGMGQGGEDLSVVAGSVTVGSGSSSSSSSSGMPPPKCTIKDPNGGATKFASAYGDASFQTGSAIAFDKSGNMIVVGAFSGSLNLGTTTLNSAGGDDVFIAKFNTGGQLMWAKSFGDGNVQTTSGIGTDTAGNIYVTGNFKGSINFGGGALSAAGVLFVDVFLVKLTPDGNHVWSQKFGDENVQNARGVAVDAGGNVIVAGYFQNTINFGGSALTSAGLDDIFLAKFNTDGMHQWSRRFGDAGEDQRARAVAIDGTGNVYIAGETAGTLDLGGGGMTATTNTSAFAAKLDSLGNATWLKLSGGDAGSKAIGNAIAVGPNGDVAVAGSFSGMFDLGGTSVSNAGVDDAFVTLFSAAGAHTYTKSFGDSELQTATGVVVAPNGELIVTGNFSGSIDLETGMPTTSAGALDGFVARLDSKGCPAWLRTYAGAGVQLTEAIALDPTTGGVALTGSFNGSADFGTGMTMASGSDVFLVSVNP
jgi:hypothetical protein